MRRLVFLASICLMTVMMSSAQTKTVTIRGIIENFKNKEVSIGYVKDYLYNTKAIPATATSDKQGEFYMKFVWNKPWPAILFIGKVLVPLFLCPGDSLFINANYPNILKTIKYEGKGGTENALLAYIQYEYAPSNIKFKKNMTKYTQEDFYAQNNVQYRRQIEFVKNSYKVDDNADFYGYFRGLIMYEYYNNVFEYAIATHQPADPEYIQRLVIYSDKNNQKAITVPVYLEFLHNYISFMIQNRENPEEEINNIWQYRYTLIKRSFTDDVRDLLLAQVLKKAFEYTYNITATILYNDYKTMYINKDYYLAIKNQFLNN